MNNGSNNAPMLKAASLWAKTSVKGGQYLTGRMGGVKVLIFENRDRQSDEDPSHHLFFVEAPSRQGTQERHGSVQERGDGGRHLTGQTPSTPHRSGFQGHSDAGADWQAPLRQDGQVRSAAGDSFEDGPPWER